MHMLCGEHSGVCPCTMELRLENCAASMLSIHCLACSNLGAWGRDLALVHCLACLLAQLQCWGIACGCAGCRANLVTHTNTHLHYNCTWLLRMPWAHSSDTLQTLQWQWGPFCTQVSTTSCLFSRCAWGSHLSWPCLAHGCGTCRRGVLTYMLCLAHSSIGRSLRL